MLNLCSICLLSSTFFFLWRYVEWASCNIIEKIIITKHSTRITKSDFEAKFEKKEEKNRSIDLFIHASKWLIDLEF